MHKVASTRIYFVLCALLSLPFYGCDSASEDDPVTPPPPAATGGSGGGGGSGSGVGGGGAGPTGELLGSCETASATDPNVHDGYFKHASLPWELAWFTYTDNAEAAMKSLPMGMITPAEKAPFVCVQDADPVRNYVFNAKGGPFSVWGAGMGFNMQIMTDPTPPGNVDLSAYKGVRFWAKVNDAGTGTVRIKMVDVQTTPVARGGSCDSALGACDNNFGTVLKTINTNWQQFDVPFAAMTQETWSSQMFSTGAQSSKVIGFQFQVGKTTFDYSVDEFELYQ